jgi:hypothetical protein
MKPTDELAAWLLAAQTPSIVYQAQKDLLAGRRSASQLRAAKARVGRSGAVPAILSRQSKDGKWKIDRGFYGPKFYSTHWSMLWLAELGADGTSGGFRRGAEYMLDATREDVRKGLETKDYGWSCLYGNILRYALRADLRIDSRMEDLVRFSARAMAAGPCDCRSSHGCACAWGAVRSLWGLAAIPKRARTKEVDRAIRQGLRFLLEDHSLAEADYPVPPGGRINPLWFKLNFPLPYHSDILFVLRVLDDLDVLDHRGARPALDWLEAQRRPDGRWNGTSPVRTRTWREMGAPEETSRWVTLQALRILRHAGRRFQGAIHVS